MNSKKGKDLAAPNEEASLKRQQLAESPQVNLQFEKIFTLRRNISSISEKRNAALVQLNTDTAQALQHERNLRDLLKDHRDECILHMSILEDKMFIEKELSRMKDEIKIMESKYVSLSDANDSLEEEEKTQRRFVELRKKYVEAEEMYSKLLQDDAKCDDMVVVKRTRYQVAHAAHAAFLSQLSTNQSEAKALDEEIKELIDKLSIEVENLKVLVDWPMTP